MALASSVREGDCIRKQARTEHHNQGEQWEGAKAGITSWPRAQSPLVLAFLPPQWALDRVALPLA